MKKILPFALLLTTLSANNVIAAETNPDLQQLQQTLAVNPNDASALNKLGEAFFRAGRYADAEQVWQKSLAIREKELPPNHPNIATSLNNLAEAYREQGKLTQAESLYLRSLAIYEKALGAEHSMVATSLNNLAALYYSQGKYCILLYRL
jgi:tetratricopeptide (TPR) repeat protein